MGVMLFLAACHECVLEVCTGMGFLVISPPVPADIFGHRTKGVNNSHRSGKTGNLLKIPHVINWLVSPYTGQCISNQIIKLYSPYTTQIVDHTRWVPAEKNHSRGNPTIARSIPAVFPQQSNPYPRETRGFRGIPVIPIPVHTSNVY